MLHIHLCVSVARLLLPLKQCKESGRQEYGTDILVFGMLLLKWALFYHFKIRRARLIMDPMNLLHCAYCARHVLWYRIHEWTIGHSSVAIRKLSVSSTVSYIFFVLLSDCDHLICVPFVRMARERAKMSNRITMLNATTTIANAQRKESKTAVSFFLWNERMCNDMSHAQNNVYCFTMAAETLWNY